MRRLITLLALSLFATHAAAEVVATQRVEKEIVTLDNSGREIRNRVNAEKVAPGEEVIYTLAFENQGSEPASDLVLVMPVPEEVDYIEGTVGGDNARVTFSIDGGKTYVARGRLTVEEGGVARPARSEEITHIRWVVPTLPGRQSGTVSYRGILR